MPTSSLDERRSGRPGALPCASATDRTLRRHLSRQCLTYGSAMPTRLPAATLTEIALRRHHTVPFASARQNVATPGALPAGARLDDTTRRARSGTARQRLAAWPVGARCSATLSNATFRSGQANTMRVNNCHWLGDVAAPASWAGSGLALSRRAAPCWHLCGRRWRPIRLASLPPRTHASSSTSLWPGAFTTTAPAPWRLARSLRPGGIARRNCAGNGRQERPLI